MGSSQRSSFLLCSVCLIVVVILLTSVLCGWLVALLVVWWLCTFTTYKCFTNINNFSNHYASNNFVLLLEWAYMYFMMGIKSQNTFIVISQSYPEKSRGHTKMVSTIQDHYYLDIPNKKSMIVYKFTASYMQVSKKRTLEARKHLQSKSQNLEMSRAMKIQTKTRTMAIGKSKTSHWDGRCTRGLPWSPNTNYQRLTMSVELQRCKSCTKLAMTMASAKQLLTSGKYMHNTCWEFPNHGVQQWTTSARRTLLGGQPFNNTQRYVLCGYKDNPKYTSSLNPNKNLAKSPNDIQRALMNNMNHVKSKFDSTNNKDLDWRNNPNNTIEVLWLL